MQITASVLGKEGQERVLYRVLPNKERKNAVLKK
jgi:hypothetical protein